jgi:pyruvate dehydrogenase E2 component (dihydrolipoamide acetyltransferase)
MEVRLPRLGEGADSGTVASIFVKVGDRVNKDQPVLELESDKAVASIPSPVAGTIVALHVKDGDTVRVGQPIFSLNEGAVPAPAPRHAPEEIEEPQEHALAEKIPGEATEGSGPQDGARQVRRPEESGAREPALPSPPPSGAPAQAKIPGPGNGGPPAASPTLRKMARELGIDLTRVRGSERGGRIVVADVRRYIERLQQSAPSPALVLPGAAPAPQRPAPVSPDFSKWGKVRTEKMSTIRRTIALRMAEAWNAVPHVTQFDEADITALMKLRKKYAPRYEKKKAHLSLTPLLLRAVARTLAQHPVFNASIDEAAGTVVFKEYVHIGIAVDTEQGLLVPVIRDVDKKSLLDLAAELQGLAERTRGRKVSIDEMQGGSFTISNQGGIGSGPFTPIVNRPEVAILGVARGAEKMLFVKTRFLRRSVLPLTLSYDHRLIDGADAARFMVDLVRNIEGITEQEIRI